MMKWYPSLLLIVVIFTIDSTLGMHALRKAIGCLGCERDPVQPGAEVSVDISNIGTVLLHKKDMGKLPKMKVGHIKEVIDSNNNVDNNSNKNGCA